MRSTVRLLLALALFTAAAHAQTWSGILKPLTGGSACASYSTSAPWECGVDWSTAGVQGGIPSGTWTQAGTTIAAATCGNGASDCAPTIQAALTACGTNHFVLLGNGTFKLSSGGLVIPRNCALRGSGANLTILNSVISSGTPVALGTGSPSYSSPPSITAGTAVGSTSITVSSVAGIVTGDYVVIMQQNDGTIVSIAGADGTCTQCDAGFDSGVYSQGQISKVTNVVGTTLTIDPPLYTAYTHTPIALIESAYTQFAGLENLQIFANNTGAGTSVILNQCVNCWVSGIENNYTDGDHLDVFWGWHDSIVNNYFSNAYLHTSGTYDSDVDLANKTTLSLIQNNIMERLHASVILEWGSSANVIAYNYMFGNFDGTGGTTGSYLFTSVGMSAHGSNVQYNLVEGNIDMAENYDADWGSNIGGTLFRNFIVGTSLDCPTNGRATVTCAPIGIPGAPGVNGWYTAEGTRNEGLGGLSPGYNSVGNILGSTLMATLRTYGNPTQPLLNQVPSVSALCGSAPCGSNGRNFFSTPGNFYNYDIGYGESTDTGGGSGGGGWVGDSLVPTTTLLRHGDWTSTNNTITWAGGITHTLPASFYLSAKPAWFGSVPWPAIGPDVTGGSRPDGSGFANKIPAQVCYETVMGGSDGTGSPKAFNAGACYTNTPSGGSGFPYGNNCGGCGIPGGGGTNNIITSSINCVLFDSNSGDAPIQCDTSVNHYTLPLPPTVDPRAVTWTWNQTVPASCVVVTGAILNTTDRTQAVDGTGAFPAKSTSCKVTVHHLVPGSALGNAGNTVGDTMYLAGSTDGSTSNPGGTNPGAGYGNGWSAYPGPVGNNQGPAGCCFLIQTPNPQPVFPMQWELTIPGTECQSAMPCNPGYPNMLPLYLLWTGGNAPTVAGLGAVQPPNTVAHTYSGTYSAPNSGQWYTSDGTHWNPNGSSPIFVWTATITQGGNTYNCPANANGGVDPITFQPTGTCKTTGGADSGIAVIPFYAGCFSTGCGGGASPATDYRQIGVTNGKYSFNMNGAAPPLNPQPTSVAEFYPGVGSITGAMTLNLTATLYTSGAGTTPAAGTLPVTVSYPLTVAAPTPVAVNTPSFSTDPMLPAYFAYNAKSIINMFTNQSVGCSMDNWNIADSTYMWYPFGAGSFAECQTWNYDNSRVATSASDQFLHKMDGTAWPTSWTGTHTYGDNYADEEICPSSDTNGNCWVATNSTCLTGGSCGFTSGGGEPSWSSHPIPGNTVSDGGGSWINAGNQTYWNRNVNNSGQAYLNNLVLTNGGVSQFSQFGGAINNNIWRTGDAVAKSGGVTIGLYSTAIKELINGDFGGGLFSPFSGNAGRGAAYELDSLMTYWREVCREGNCAAFTANAEIQRVTYYDINSTLNYWNLFGNQSEFSTNESAAYGPVIIPFYIGLGTEAIIETLSTCHELDPGSTLPICQDPRMDPYLKTITGYMYANWWDQAFVAGEGTHNYSFSYDPRDVQNNSIIEPHFTELTGPMEPAYDYEYNRCGGDTVNCVLPGGVHYDVAADSIREHQFDGRNCSNWTCTGGGKFFGLIWNGGNPNGFGTSSPKQLGQSDKWGLGNSYNWRLGFSTYQVTDLTPSRNPVWNGGSGAQPYPDTVGPYPFQIITPGSSGQDDPGAEGHFTGRSDSPVYAFSSTSANIQFWTYEQTVASKVSYGANPTCNAGAVLVEDAGYPLQQNLSSVTTYLHHFTLTGLTPSTNYFLQFSATDAAGNTAHNSCAAQSIGQGGGINFTTLASTGPVILTSALPNGSVGTSYTATLQGSGGFPPYAFTLTGSLPPGLSFSTPTISGTPTGTGATYPLTINMHDSVGTAAPPVSTSITITDLTITNTSLAGGTFGTPYSQTLVAGGGVPPDSWSHILGILPPGISLAASTGVISGTPTACNTYSVTWKVTDSTSTIATKPLPITITGCTGTVTITTPLPLHNCVVNTACPNQQETASGGVPSYTWAVTAGSLPTGMTLGSSTGIVGGTPTATGTFNFSVTATDSGSLASAPSPQSITVISTGQLGVTIKGSVTATGSVTIGTPNP